MHIHFPFLCTPKGYSHVQSLSNEFIVTFLKWTNNEKENFLGEIFIENILFLIQT